MEIRMGKPEEAKVLAELIWSSDGGALKVITVNNPAVIEKLIRSSAEQPTLLFSCDNIVVVDNGGFPAGLVFGYDFDILRVSKKPTFWGLLREIGWRRFLHVLPNLLRLAWKTRIKAGDFYLSNIVVFPEYQYTGVGSHLLQYVERYCGGKRIVLDVAEENTNARRFYRHRGYRNEREWQFCGKKFIRMVKGI